jgi:phage tail sheath gpL-like
MAYTTVVVLEHTDPLPGITSGAKHRAVQSLVTLLQAVAAGAKRGVEIDIHANTSAASAAASGTVTCASVDVADAVTIGGVTFTAAAAEDTGAGEFDQSGTDDECATSLAACIAASSLAGVVSAAAEANVVTVTAVHKGAAGNAIALTTTDGTDLAVSGAALSGGTGGATAAVNFTL